jgi:tight adherence protein B
VALMEVAIGALAIFLALLILILVVWSPSEESKVGVARLSESLPPMPGGGQMRVSATQPREKARERLAALAEEKLAKSGRQERLAAALDGADISLRPGEFVVLVLMIGAGSALVLLLALGVPGLLLALVATPLTAKACVSVRTSRRRRAFEEQLPDVLQLLVSALRAGYGLPQALNAAATQCAEPAKKEFQRVLMEARVGRDPGDALGAVAARMQSRDFEWVVDATQINREVGGELAQVLDNVSETVRSRQTMRRQVKTLTAEGRMSAYVLTALPFVLIAALLLTNPGYFAPMAGKIGVLLGIASVLLMSVGWMWMRRVIRAQM